MDTRCLSPNHLPNYASESTNNVSQLIQQGIDCISQGKSAEGIFLLTQACNQLSLAQSDLSAMLEDAIAACQYYDSVQQSLFKASKDYAQADVERTAQLTALSALLVTESLPVIASSASLALSNSPYPETRALSQVTATGKSHTITLPALSITCFGHFAVRRGKQLVELCHSRSGQTILRYLIAQPGYRATADVLMEVLWPEEEPDVARRRLQVATSSLRSSLNEGYQCDTGNGYILCKNQLYQINPSIAVATDVDEFLRLYHTGQHTSREQMVACYEQACRLYHGPFLLEDIYASWSMRLREQLSLIYLSMCGALSRHFLDTSQYEHAIRWANTVLSENRCDEEAYRQLMRSYTALGRRSEALRQYHACEQVLMEELGVTPMPETTQLHQALLLGQHASTSEAPYF